MAKEKSSESGNVPPPQVLAMVICDAIWTEPISGKRSILGCFSEFFAKQFPALYPIMGVYLALTNGRGAVSLRLQMMDVDEESDPIFAWSGEVEFADPRDVVEIDFEISNPEFPLPGEYRVQLFADGEFILERRLFATKSPGNGEDEK